MDTVRELLASIWLKGFGYAHYETLRQQQVSLTELFTLSKQQLALLGFTQEFVTSLQNIPWDKVDACCAWGQQTNQSVIGLHDENYPALLKQISSLPLVLFAWGNPAILSQPQIAIVGSRHCTPMGREQAFRFGHDLAQQQISVCSGLALGIDAAAHQGALTAGGTTVAVMGTGMDEIYPRQHKKLAHQISEQGVVLSEFPLGSKPLAQNFPRRNRIISGLSHGVLVVEAAQKSGSLITAKFALEQGRDVFAIPGDLSNPQAKGCHSLIQQGAKLVQSLEDICTEMPFMVKSCTFERSHHQKIIQKSLDAGQVKLLACVAFSATPVDLICSRVQWPLPKVLAMLNELEILAQVTRVTGGYIKNKVT